MQAREGQPATGSPKSSFRTTIKAIMTKDSAVRAMPPQEAMDKGTWEKLIMPSMLYWNSFQKLHLVSPAARSTFS